LSVFNVDKCEKCLPRRVGELHLVAVDDVAEQLSVDTCHPTLDVELTHEPEDGKYSVILFIFSVKDF